MWQWIIVAALGLLALLYAVWKLMPGSWQQRWRKALGMRVAPGGGAGDCSNCGSDQADRSRATRNH